MGTIGSTADRKFAEEPSNSTSATAATATFGMIRVIGVCSAKRRLVEVTEMTREWGRRTKQTRSSTAVILCMVMVYGVKKTKYEGSRQAVACVHVDAIATPPKKNAIKL